MTVPQTTENYNPAPRWAVASHDLPQAETAQAFLIDDKRLIKIENRLRQMIEALLIGPLYCASTVRLSDLVFRLKRDHGVLIATKTTPAGRDYYELDCTVQRIGGAS